MPIRLAMADAPWTRRIRLPSRDCACGGFSCLAATFCRIERTAPLAQQPSAGLPVIQAEQVPFDVQGVDSASFGGGQGLLIGRKHAEERELPDIVDQAGGIAVRLRNPQSRRRAAGRSGR